MSAESIDWAALRERLAMAMARTSRDPRAILDARAIALARPLVDESARAATLQPALDVRIGHERYALPLADVVEIVRADSLTPLPGSSFPVTALIAWRGRALAVAARTLDGSASRRVIVVGGVRAALGIAVDEVGDVRLLDLGVIVEGNDAPRASTLPGRGVLPDAIAVLDVAALIRLAERGAGPAV